MVVNGKSYLWRYNMTNYELYINTLKSLASSQGCYARALDEFNKMSDAEKERLDKHNRNRTIL